MQTTSNSLTRYAWLSITAAVVTISLKLGAFWLTNAVSLLSDALESLVNLAAAIVALIALTIAARPADDAYAFGYSKAEFFSSGFEGGMILLAAGSIAATAIPRLIHPMPIEQVGLGLVVSVIASLINLGVAQYLKAAGKRYGSITLQADAHHLMTDVFTTAGVLFGVLLVSLTGWLVLDPLIAIIVAVNILRTGLGLMIQAGKGLMDASLPDADIQVIRSILEEQAQNGVKFHALRTRSAAARGFVSMHILVPGGWTVDRSHKYAEQVEAQVRARFPKISVLTHVEPVEDPISLEDDRLDKE